MNFNYVIGPLAPIDVFEAGMSMEDFTKVSMLSPTVYGLDYTADMVSQVIQKTQAAIDYVYARDSDVREYYIYSIPAFLTGDDPNYEGSDFVVIVKADNNGITYVFLDNLNLISQKTMVNILNYDNDAKVVKLK